MSGPIDLTVGPVRVLWSGINEDMIVFVDSFLGCHLVQGLQARKNGEVFHGLVIHSAIEQTRDWIQLRHSNVIELDRRCVLRSAKLLFC
jgi:hypothetical protein